MARIVTGSVADSVAPTEIASTNVNDKEPGSRVNRKRIRPMTTAERNVPAKAKVKMVPMLRKKLAWCNSYPDDKIMGGRRRLKKIS